MIELRQDDIQEEAEFEHIDLEDESLGISEAYLPLREADHNDRVRFEQIPDESRVGRRREGCSRSNGLTPSSLFQEPEQNSVTHARTRNLFSQET